MWEVRPTYEQEQVFYVNFITLFKWLLQYNCTQQLIFIGEKLK